MKKPKEQIGFELVGIVKGKRCPKCNGALIKQVSPYGYVTLGVCGNQYCDYAVQLNVKKRKNEKTPIKKIQRKRR